MKSLSPNMEKVGQMISAKTGSAPSMSGKMDKNDKKKKKHLKFNFMKKS